MAITSPEIVRPVEASPASAEPRPVVLDVRGLTVRYNGDPAIENITFSVRAGDQVAVIGPNGAGKSTLMNAIVGLLQPQAGTVIAPPQRLGYVAQHDAVNWDFPATVRDVVMMGRVRQIGWLRWPGRKEWQAVDAALERVGMAGLGYRQVGELSGGQRRRLFIARALAQNADILLLDEPFSGVDARAQADLLDVLDQLHHDGITLLLSTHDLGLAFERFSTVMALKRRLIAYGRAQEVYTPAVLTELYGGKLATLRDGQQVTVYVDDHACEGC